MSAVAMLSDNSALICWISRSLLCQNYVCFIDCLNRKRIFNDEDVNEAEKVDGQLTKKW
jgi:hypothetical protein